MVDWLACCGAKGGRRARLLTRIAACLRLAQLLPDFSGGGENTPSFKSPQIPKKMEDF